MSQYIHLAVRVSDEMYGGLPNTVLRHNHIAFQHGAVWFGKPGFAIREKTANQINEQVQQKYTTYAYFIDPDRKNPIAYSAELFGVSLRSPKEKEQIPLFYKELRILSRMKSWLKVGYLEAIKLEEFGGLDEANNSYTVFEMKLSKHNVINPPGYFELVDTNVE